MTVEAEEAGEVAIRSELVVFPSRSGRKVVGFLDIPEGVPTEGPFVVVTPKFGESKKNNLQLAYQLAANGLRVLRFDHTNHVGESEGEIEDYTFSGAIDDIVSAIDYLEQNQGAGNVQVVANSLSARCALRVAATDARVVRLVTMVGVVNFRETAKVVYQRDMVGEYLEGRMQGISDILGHQVNVDNFLKDCIEHNLHDLRGSMEDVENAQCAIFFFNAERDVWVNIEEIRQLQRAADSVTVSTIKEAMHELRENPEAAQGAALSLVHTCKTGRIPDSKGRKKKISVPRKKVVFAQNKVERNRLREAAPLRESEQEFWREYLQKYNILEAVGDYQDYLKLIGDCLGPLEAGKIYFDCGCGNGMYGAWCLRDILLRSNNRLDPPPLYFGLDLTAKGLADALRRHMEASGEDRKRGEAMLNLLYLRFDLDELDPGSGGLRLPFEDSSVDRICCSLLISYLKRPELLLSELYRILKKGGRIVVSSMKPFCDLSVIYKDVVDEASSESTLQSARNLLTAAGAIKLKEEEGHYKFYAREELIECVSGAGFKRAKFYRSFGDQANLVCAEK